jgi:hypothetical protein
MKIPLNTQTTYIQCVIETYINMLFVAEYQCWFFVFSFIWQNGSPVKGVFFFAQKIGTFLCHMQV